MSTTAVRPPSAGASPPPDPRLTQFRMMMTFQRACAWGGAACIAIFIGGFALAGFIPPVGADDSAAEIARHYREHQVSIQLGGLCFIVAGLFYAAFTGVISAQMSRIPGVHRSVHYVQLASGAFGCLTYLVPGLFLEIAAFRVDRPDETIRLLNDMFWILAVMPWTPFLTQNWAFAWAILADRRSPSLFPRWLAYFNVWAPISFAPSVLLPFFHHGPFAWQGIFVVWIPAIVFILQFAANVTCLLRAIADEEAAGPPAPEVSDVR
ncbi:hypothetical protein SK069_19410 [Patulibacter brassicae]|uniref:DUF4328 domain-containing protein n=1 Tax=Patulibacter brassicae TaxID=1705717 RepID=A0ABU4VPI3_9ACTN|nr:hypothetical protein [Patulibacter brassicae]MDX8153774.1 hypothetical protein [Patulibacter brassicae]